VVEDVRVVAPGFFEGVRKDGEAGGVEMAGGQGALLVSGSGEAEHCWGEIDRLERGRAKWVSEDATECVCVVCTCLRIVIGKWLANRPVSLLTNSFAILQNCINK